MDEHDGRNSEIESGPGGTEFDRLLRSSLETYADAGPDSGIAERVLARIGAEGGGGRARRLSPWAIALPIAACLIIAVSLLGSKPLHNFADRTTEARVTLPKSSGASPTGPIASTPSAVARREHVSRPMRQLSRASTGTNAARLPKLDVFPAPQPLTREEQALVAYVAGVPEAKRKTLIEDEKQIDAPLTIEALEIKPLTPPELQGN